DRGIHGGADLNVNAGRKDDVEGLEGLGPAGAYAGDLRVVGARRLDVQAHPIDEVAHVREAPRVRTARVEPDTEARVPDLEHRRTQGPLARGLAAREHDAVEQTAALREQVADTLERDRAISPGRDEVGVVAVRAAPRA